MKKLVQESVEHMNVKSSLRGPVAPQNTGRPFFHILLCFYHFCQDSTFMENVEETLNIEEYSFPWYCIDLWSSNLWKKKKI